MASFDVNQHQSQMRFDTRPSESKERKMLFVVATLSFVALSAECFPSHEIPCRNVCSRRSNVVESRRTSANFIGPSLLSTASDKKPSINTEEGSENWTMEEDWALIDNLPLFTVSSTIETRTFWTQLWSANSILFLTKEPEDLYQRAIKLEKENDSRKKINSQKFEKDRLIFGPSPPILENWKIDPDAKGNMIVGQLTMKDNAGRRTIWFHYHLIGRLQGDPFVDEYSSTVSLFPGCYIEAVGGRVYKLGQPLSLDEWGKKTNLSVDEKEAFAIDSRKHDEESPRISQWWLTGSTVAVTAFVTSSILSACIGYGAGLSIIQDGSHNHQTPSSAPAVVTYPSQNGIMTRQESSLYQVTAAARTDNFKSDVEPSIEELRARTQYKVSREERFLRKISQRLEVDKEYLKLLEEQQQQASQLLP